MNAKNILVIGPSFFDYEKDIQEDLTLLGYTVFFIDDRFSNNSIVKILIRLFKNSINFFINRYFNIQLLKCKDISFDLLFVYNPEAFNLEILEKIKHTHPKISTRLYLWDSFNNKSNFINLYKSFDKVYTFDRFDSATYKINYLPLFYNRLFEETKSSSKVYDFSFIGTAHSTRIKDVKDFIKSNKENLKNYYTFFYLQSYFQYIYFKLTDKYFKNVSIKDISFKPLDKKSIAEIVSKSKYVLDISHPNQKGLTMRTFEVLGNGTKLITNNVEILNEPFYNCDIIKIVNQDNIDFINSKDSIRIDFSNYSLRYWLKKILT